MGFTTITYILDVPLDQLLSAFEGEGDLKLLSFSRKLLRVKARYFDLTALEGSKTIRVTYQCEGDLEVTTRNLVENKLLSLKPETR